MEREDIERRDFPVGRRGYDQAAVDAHLRGVADEIERLKARRARPARPAASLSAGTSEQVRLILEAAERGAADLREDAGRQAKAHVARVEEAAEGMLARLDALQGELGTLLDGLRASGERLDEGLAALQAQVGDVDPLPAAEPAPEPEDFAAAASPSPSPSRSRNRSPSPGAAARERRRRGRRAHHRAQHGARRLLARGDRRLPGRELLARRSRRAARRRLREGRAGDRRPS